MREPTYAALDELKRRGNLFAGYAEHLHPDPRMYKYHWSVFHAGSSVEGWGFLSEEQDLCTHAAMKLIDELKAKGEPCMVYNTKSPRKGSRLEIYVDHEHPRWKDRHWASSFDEDTDPVWNGHK